MCVAGTREVVMKRLSLSITYGAHKPLGHGSGCKPRLPSHARRDPDHWRTEDHQRYKRSYPPDRPRAPQGR